jgi:predicted acyltransferase
MNVNLLKTSLPQRRLTSLDVFRGATIAFMIIVNNQGGVGYSFLQHADWNGWTPTDLVFPFFIFIVGVAIPYALNETLDQGVSKKRLLLRITRRTIILFGLGLFVNGFPTFELATFRIMGVLQRIALCYFFASLIFLFLKPRWRIVLTMTIPIAYWMLMTLVPVPGYGPGVLDKNGNLAGYIDRLLLNGHLFIYSGTWDPEGLLSTLPAVATALIGVLAGQYLRSNSKPLNKAENLFFFGSISVAIGSLWNYWFPINKNLWTSSYVAFTGGIAFILLATCFYVIDIKGHKHWTKPFVMLGLNSIFIYVLSEIVNLALIYASVPLTQNANTALKSLIYERLFVSWAGPLHGSFLYAIVFLAFCWAISAVLYRKRIFIKI